MAEAPKLTLDMNEIAIGDIEDFEAYTGETIGVLDKIADGAGVSAKIYTGLALLALRQQNPEATIEEARRIKIGELQQVAAGDPTPAEPAEITRLREDKPARARRSAS